MGNAAWLCFVCREAARRPTWHRDEVPCPRCGEAMRPIGHRIPVPPKRDLKAWTTLREQLNRAGAEAHDRLHEAAVRRRHLLEQQVDELQRRPRNSGSDKAIKLLREEIALYAALAMKHGEG